MTDQTILTITIGILISLLVWGKWRYDAVTLVCLAGLVLFGVVPAENAFIGFGHPAVITVALVLLISRGLQEAGMVSLAGNFIARLTLDENQYLILIMIVAAFLSSFMNNIGAMALLLPITLSLCQKMEWNPSKFLMPLAFASILGGMNTKIGTPPNIIISEFREDFANKTFEFFDFAFAGLPISILGILFIAFLGWRFVKLREEGSEQIPLVDIQDYLIEMTISEDSILVGKRIHELTSELGTDNVLMGVVSEKGTIRKPHHRETFEALQILVLKILYYQYLLY